MKRNRAVVALALGIAVACAADAGAVTNLLANPDFEIATGGLNAGAGDQTTAQAGSPWSGWNTWVPPYGAYISPIVRDGAVRNHPWDNHTPGGNQVGKSFGSNAGLMQFLPASAGQEYTASGWVLKGSDDQWTDIFQEQTVDVRMVFWNVPPAAAANQAGDRIQTSVSTTVVNGATPMDVWNQLSVTATAPENTQTVQFLFFYNNPNSAGGAFFTDDASLTLKAAPPALAGDVNSDGFVNQLDLNIVGANWLASGATLALGDANGDTFVNQLDLNLIGANWLAQAGAVAALTAVPEPACLAAVALPLVAFRRRAGTRK